MGDVDNERKDSLFKRNEKRTHTADIISFFGGCFFSLTDGPIVMVAHTHTHSFFVYVQRGDEVNRFILKYTFRKLHRIPVKEKHNQHRYENIYIFVCVA